MSVPWPSTHSVNGILLDLQQAGTVRVAESGIDSSADVRSDLQPKSQQHGLWDTPNYYGGRPIPITGYAEHSTPQLAHAFLNSLRALGGAGLVEFSVSSDGRGTRTCSARVQSGVVPQWMGDRAFKYSLTLMAPDPLLYGPEVFGQTTLSSTAGGTGLSWPLSWPLSWGVAPGVTPGAVPVPNAGTASYYPRLRVNGPVTNPVLTLIETGDMVRYNGTLAAGQHLDINWGVPRRVTIGDNPVSVRHKITYAGNFLAVPVGGGSIDYSADTADPAAILSVWSREGAWE